MTRPVVTATPEMVLEEVGTLFHDHRFHHLPVVDPQNRVVGMLSDRDLLACSRAAAPHGESADPLHASDLMSARVLSATPDTPIRDIALGMIAEGIGALPLVDSESRLTGIITTTDILRGLVQEAPLELWI